MYARHVSPTKQQFAAASIQHKRAYVDARYKWLSARMAVGDITKATTQQKKVITNARAWLHIKDRAIRAAGLVPTRLMQTHNITTMGMSATRLTPHSTHACTNEGDPDSDGTDASNRMPFRTLAIGGAQ